MNTYLLITLILIPITAVLGFIVGLISSPRIKDNKLYKGLVKLADENLALKIENVELKNKLKKEKLN